MMQRLPPKIRAESINNSFRDISTPVTVSAEEISIANATANSY